MTLVSSVDYTASDDTARTIILQNQDTHLNNTPIANATGPEIIVYNPGNGSTSSNDRFQIRATDGSKKAVFIRSHYNDSNEDGHVPPCVTATFWIADPDNTDDGREDSEIYLIHPSDGHHFRIRIATTFQWPTPRGVPQFVLD